MIADRNRDHILRLLRSYTTNPSTEEMLYLMAEPSGMLEACKWLMQMCGINDQKIKDWIEKACHENKVNSSKFFSEIEYILSLFSSSQATDSSLYALLDLKPGATKETIKQRYRQLCRRFHPDAALGNKEQDTETFITLTKAYHTLLSREEEKQPTVQTTPNHQWRQQYPQGNRAELKRKNIMWFSILALFLAILSLMAAKTYNTHIMMTGLRNKGTAFVPPQRKTDNTHKKSVPRTSSSPEPTKVVHTPEKPATLPPSAPADLPVMTLSTVLEEAAVIKMPAQPQPEPLPKAHVAAVTPSIPVEASQQKKAAAPPVAPTEHHITRPQGIPGQVTLNKTGEQTMHTGASTFSIGKKLPAEPRVLPKKPQEKPVGLLQPEVVTKHDPKTNEKGKKTPPLQQRVLDDQHHIAPLMPIAPPAASPSPTLAQQPNQKDIEAFLHDYTAAYQQKNLLAFSRFFALDATENGKSLKDILMVYSHLFESTKSLRLAISLLNWEQEKTMINLRGRFAIALTYNDGKKIQGRGAIHFHIANEHGKLQIKTLTYAFDQ